MKEYNVTESAMDKNLEMSGKEIIDFCTRWQVLELSIFGSALRDDFNSNSDVDVLVSFRENAPWGVFELVDMKDELEKLFGRPVDLVEKEALSNPFRKREILDTKKVIYAA